MATAALYQMHAGDRQPEEAALYQWCADYCVFRGDRAPQDASEVPVVVKGRAPLIVRKVYVGTDGVTRVVTASKTGQGADDRLTAFNTQPSQAQLTAAFNRSAADAGATKVNFNFLKMGTLVMVGAANPDDDMQGAGGVDGASAPSYQIIGTLANTVERDDTSATINMYVRGGHIMAASQTITVPFSGYDQFWYAGAHSDEISDALDAAYQKLSGLGQQFRAGQIEVGADGTVSRGNQPVTGTSLDGLQKEVSGWFQSDPGARYAAAAANEWVYTYAHDTQFSVDIARAAHINLAKAGTAGATNTALQGVIRAVFGNVNLDGEDGPPPGDGTGTGSDGDANTPDATADLRAKLAKTSAALRDAQDTIVQRNLTIRNLQDRLSAAGAQPGIAPGPAPRPAPRPAPVAGEAARIAHELSQTRAEYQRAVSEMERLAEILREEGAGMDSGASRAVERARGNVHALQRRIEDLMEEQSKVH